MLNSNSVAKDIKIKKPARMPAKKKTLATFPKFKTLEKLIAALNFKVQN